MRKALFVAAALLALGLGGLFAHRMRRAEEVSAPAQAKPVAARTDPAAAGDPRGFVGVVFPRQQVDLASVAAARVKDVKVQLGTRLATGDVVATLDSDSLRRELDAAEAAVRAAQAEARAARVESQAAAERSERLERFAEGVAGEERIQAANQQRLTASRVSASRARVAEAEARVEQLRVLVESSAITAPFDGVIAARYVDPGALVNPGEPIARLISADDLWVRFAVPDQQAGTARVGSCVQIAVESPEVTARGVVEMVAPQVDTELRMLVVEARLMAAEEWRDRLQAGLAARVQVVPCVTP
ncbi:MAG TPA: efflux RND transporter periplasmic adaptor subunit [Kofleriaceae bacterium]|nr:efflux RND transporter periplasmic adaptor subunit [Kofleriaceae bacterium]